jgi:hypothetical protein
VACGESLQGLEELGVLIFKPMSLINYLWEKQSTRKQHLIKKHTPQTNWQTAIKDDG